MAYLDNNGLQYFWQKVKAYIDAHSGGGGGVAGTVLFDYDANPLYSSANLTSSALVYDSLLVICKDNDGIYTNVVVDAPALNKKFAAMTCYPGNSNFWIKGKTFVISTATRIDVVQDSNDWLRGETNTAGGYVGNDDKITIVKVIGYNS